MALPGYDQMLAAGPPCETAAEQEATRRADAATLQALVDALGEEAVFGPGACEVNDRLDGSTCQEVLVDYLSSDGTLDVERFVAEGVPRLVAEVQRARERCGENGRVVQAYWRVLRDDLQWEGAD